jgi:hypothetical protein
VRVDLRRFLEGGEGDGANRTAADGARLHRGLPIAFQTLRANRVMRGHAKADLPPRRPSGMRVCPFSWRLTARFIRRHCLLSMVTVAS